MQEFFRAPSGTGPARSFAVFAGPEGTQHDDADAVLAGRWRNFLKRCPDGLRLDEDGLEFIEDRIDGWAVGPGQAGKAATGAGLFLGELLTETLERARWRILPNGYPVVRLGGGLDLDVLAAARARVEGREPHLPSLYALALERYELQADPHWSLYPEGPPGADWVELEDTGWDALLAWSAGPGNVTREPHGGQTGADPEREDNLDEYLFDAGIPPRPRGYRWYLRRPPGSHAGFREDLKEAAARLPARAGPREAAAAVEQAVRALYAR